MGFRDCICYMLAFRRMVALVTMCCFSTSSLAMHPSPKMPITTKYKIDRSSGGQLYSLTGSIEVYSDPRKNSDIIGEYEVGAMFVVIGQAVGTEYLYVSPCNACENGFVEKAVFSKSLSDEYAQQPLRERDYGARLELSMGKLYFFFAAMPNSRFNSDGRKCPPAG